MMEMVATGPSPGLLPVSFFRMIGTVIISRGVRVHLVKVWVMMLWAGLLTRALNHRLRVELKGENFLGSLLSQRSPCITTERTLWSTLATSTRECLFTLGIKPWCAKCSYPIWGSWRWDSSTIWKKVLLAPLRSSLGPLGLVSWLAVKFFGLWIPCCLWPCERGRPWKRILIGTGRCSMR